MVTGKYKHYMISVVAEMLGIHQQTLRLYEREGVRQAEAERRKYAVVFRRRY